VILEPIPARDGRVTATLAVAGAAQSTPEVPGIENALCVAQMSPILAIIRREREAPDSGSIWEVW